MTELELADWRRRVSELYAAVRAEPSPERGHALWRAGRDELFREHPQSPLEPGDPLRATGLPVWPYDPRLRFSLPLRPPPAPAELSLPAGSDGTTLLRLIGRVELPGPLRAAVDVWWLEQYGGGLFLPLRDGTAGTSSYGGGRYLLDTAKGADLGGTDGSLVVDLNFLYHPSCRYSDSWVCPLAPAGNTIAAPVRAGNGSDSVLQGAGVGGNIHRVGGEGGQRHDLECPLMGRGQHHRRGGAVAVRPQPVRGGHAPPVPRHEPGELERRHRGGEIVPDAALMLQELGGDHGADRVAAQILRAGAAAAVAVEAGEGVGAARLQLAAQDIALGHESSIPTRGAPDKHRPGRGRRQIRGICS